MAYKIKFVKNVYKRFNLKKVFFQNSNLDYYTVLQIIIILTQILNLISYKAAFNEN